MIVGSEEPFRKESEGPINAGRLEEPTVITGPEGPTMTTGPEGPITTGQKQLVCDHPVWRRAMHATETHKGSRA